MLKLLLFSVLLSVARPEDLQKIIGDWKLVAIFSDSPVTDKDFKRDCNPMTISVVTDYKCDCGDKKDVSVVSAMQNGTLLDSRAAIVVETKEELEKYRTTSCHCGELGMQTPGVLLTLSQNHVLMYNWPTDTAQVLISRVAPSLPELEEFVKTVDVLKTKNSFAGCLREYENKTSS